MLTLVDLAQVLRRVDYKRDWRFHLYDDEYEGHHLAIEVYTPDAANPPEHVVLGIKSPLPPFDTEGEFLRWLAWRIRRIESHEVREWFKFDGKPVSDPHR